MEPSIAAGTVSVHRGTSQLAFRVDSIFPSLEADLKIAEMLWLRIWPRWPRSLLRMRIAPHESPAARTRAGATKELKELGKTC